MKFSIVSLATMMIYCCWNTDSAVEAADNFEKECLDKHNYYRKLCGVPPLKLNKTISEFSRKWAKSLAKRNTFEHSGNRNYGECLYSAWSSSKAYKISGSAAVTAWYNEIKDYKTYNKEPSPAVRGKAGHYTQVVWKDSRQLGVGVAETITDSGVKYIVVCNYGPPGNWIGSYKKNVFPPK